MASMTPREAADFRLRGVLAWGAALTAVGLLLLGVTWASVPDGGSGLGNDATIFLFLTLLTLVPGLGLLQVGLVAVGVRLGLAAYGVAPSDEPAPR